MAEAADAPRPRRERGPRGYGARLRRIQILQELEKAGLLSYLELIEPTASRTSAAFCIEIAGRQRLLTGVQVEHYVQGMLDAIYSSARRPAPGSLDKVDQLLRQLLPT